MAVKEKSKVPFAIIVAAVLGAFALVSLRDEPFSVLSGFPDDLDFFLPGSSEEKEKEVKRVCLDITSIPTAELHVNWRIGVEGGIFKRRVRIWEECRDAHSGDVAELKATKTRSGNVGCSITLLGKTGHTNLLSKMMPGTNPCEVRATIP